MQTRAWAQAVADTRSYLLEENTLIPTGYSAIDEYLRGGMRVGRMALLLGRTEVGKTTMALNIAVNAVRKGVPVAVASLEMTRQEIAIRAVSAAFKISVEKAEAEMKSSSPSPLLLKSLEELSGLMIDDSTKPSWTELGEWVEKLESKVVRPKLVVLDHLKLMQRGFARSEAERVQMLGEDAKTFAKDADIALLVIHQVGRAVEGGDDDRRRNHGDIPLTIESSMYGAEQDSDYIFGIFRPERDPNLDAARRARVAGRMFFQILKNRHGESCMTGLPLQWKRPTMWIDEGT